MFDEKSENDLQRKATDEGDAVGHSIRPGPVQPTDTEEPSDEDGQAEGHGWTSDTTDVEDEGDTEGHERA